MRTGPQLLTETFLLGAWAIWVKPTAVLNGRVRITHSHRGEEDRVATSLSPGEGLQATGSPAHACRILTVDSEGLHSPLSHPCPGLWGPGPVAILMGPLNLTHLSVSQALPRSLAAISGSRLGLCSLSAAASSLDPALPVVRL